MSIEPINYRRGKLDILDQLLLPSKHEYVPINDTTDGWNAIKKMQVRGAPAIAIVGCLSLAVEILTREFDDVEDFVSFVDEKLSYLVTARPTAVNIKEAAVRHTAQVKKMAAQPGCSVKKLRNKLLTDLELMYDQDISNNKAMGQYGAEHILNHHGNKNVKILTHCNTGSLATAGYGTALGVVRRLTEMKKLDHCFCTETRPYNQGARLTAYELVYEKIPSTLICDSMAAMVMSEKGISAVVVGADRVVRNGDTANKIGTFQLAVVAKYHTIPFYIACPYTTFDPNLKTGAEIVIEERPAAEMTSIKGIQIAPEGIGCFNPAFDVTPAELITGGIITEYGVFPPEKLYEELSSIDLSKNSSA